ncbi:hypothetical protein CCM_08241 [Cordyceps militaris CM01]|uniref:Uncharacterized protein n=1 Tax=Cordyceps militaris (strain CM01) TaxID=983644 RepID=G3JNG8_CORMM|nr:uncharacterized protein CCM_08241 [Cordyceps militaris CM01]EGX89987.1 hypothetical protein CCM_08241 [Cordyceps militaris CM01]
MPHQLSIPPCVLTPAHPHHLPPIQKPLRINIEGPTPAGPELADLTYRTLYGKAPVLDTDLVVRDEYLGWIRRPVPLRHIDYYGVTFDHLVREDDADPEVLQINILEMDDDGDPLQYAGVRILAVPRCCQKRNGKTDRKRVNNQVEMRKARSNGISWETIYKSIIYHNSGAGPQSETLIGLAPIHSRALGVITKPDALIPGSGSERDFISLARNQDVEFRLGWHVLRNRGTEADLEVWAFEQRDAAELQLLSSGAWAGLSLQNVGIKSLRGRLSKVLVGRFLLSCQVLSTSLSYLPEARNASRSLVCPETPFMNRECISSRLVKPFKPCYEEHSMLEQ